MGKRKGLGYDVERAVRSTGKRARRTRRLAKAAERRALMRGQREAHRRGLDVRSVRVSGKAQYAWSDDAPVERSVMRVFRGVRAPFGLSWCAHFADRECPNCEIPF